MEPSISLSTITEAAFGRLHNSGAGAFGSCPTVGESIMEDGEIDGSIYGTIYPMVYGSQNCAGNKGVTSVLLFSWGSETYPPESYPLLATPYKSPTLPPQGADKLR